MATGTEPRKARKYGPLWWTVFVWVVFLIALALDAFHVWNLSPGWIVVPIGVTVAAAVYAAFRPRIRRAFGRSGQA